MLTIAQVPAVDLAAPGNVAEWFSSVLLLAAAGLGILTSLIRRHRVDDYRGRYRMWYWVVPLLFVASLNQVSDLSTSLRTAVLVLAGIPGYPDAALIWTASLTLVAAVVGIRLAIEMRACRLAVVSLAVALASYVAVGAIATELDPGRRRSCFGSWRSAASGWRPTSTCFWPCASIRATSFAMPAGGCAQSPARNPQGQAPPQTRSSRPRNRRSRRSPHAAESAAPSEPTRKSASTQPHTTSTSARHAKVGQPSPSRPNRPLDTSKRRPPTPSRRGEAGADSSDDDFDLDDDADGDNSCQGRTTSPAQAATPGTKAVLHEPEPAAIPDPSIGGSSAR